MKKLNFMFMIFILLLGGVLLNASSIRILQPNASDTFFTGDICNIKWVKAGPQSGFVKIRLLDPFKRKKVLNIINRVMNNGYFQWVIPKSVIPGKYVLRIKTIDNKVFYDTKPFIIDTSLVKIKKINGPISLSEVPQIIIKSPSSNTTWEQGKSYNIKWEKKGNPSGFVKIRLFNSRMVKILKISEGYPNTGIYTWRIPVKIASGKYKIRIKTTDNKVFDDSPLFSINNSLNNVSVMKGATPGVSEFKPIVHPELIIISPKKDDIFKDRKTINISWIKKGTQNSYVKIKLFSYPVSMYGTVISDKTSNSGQFQWNLSSNIISGKYKIRVSTVDGKVTGESGVFEIKKKSAIELETWKIIKVLSPKRGDTLYTGDPVEVRWDYSGYDPNSLVNIFFYSTDNNGSKKYKIRGNHPLSTGAYGFKLGSSIPAGEYIARVELTTGTGNPNVRISETFIDGGKFEIKKRGIIIIGNDNIQNNTETLIQPALGSGGDFINPAATHIIKFKAVNSTIEPGRYSIISYEYKNVQSAEIENVNTGKIIKSLGTEASKKDTYIVYPTKTTKYRLIVRTKDGKGTAETEVVVKKEMSLEMFTSDEKYYKVGDTVGLIYQFKGADYATISDNETGNILKYISLNGDYKVDGKAKFVFKHPTKYVLTISSNNGKNVQKAYFSTYVNRDLKLKQGINRFDIIANWRFAEEHIDFIIDVFGAKSIAIYFHNRKTGRTLRTFYMELDSYERYKVDRRPARILPSKDFAKTYYATYRVLFWDGQVVNKRIDF